MKRLVFNFLSFQVGWFACVMGAARGIEWVGPAVVGMLVAANLVLSRNRGWEAFLLVSVGAIGAVIDSTVIGLGIFHARGTLLLGGVCPAWLLSLWVLFGSTLNVSLRWLRGRALMASLLGGVGGALAYFAGSRFGAISFHHAPVLSVAIIGGVWALVTPGGVALARWVDQRATGPVTGPAPSTTPAGE